MKVHVTFAAFDGAPRKTTANLQPVGLAPPRGRSATELLADLAAEAGEAVELGGTAFDGGRLTK